MEKKRRRFDEEQQNGFHCAIKENIAPPMSHDCAPPVAAASRRFLRLPAHGGIFDSQSVTGAGSDTTLYQPVGDNLLVNVALVDQISFSQGTYFVADTDGTYLRSEAGKTINLWRYDANDRRLHISRAFLFTDPQVFDLVMNQLEDI